MAGSVEPYTSSISARLVSAGVRISWFGWTERTAVLWGWYGYGYGCGCGCVVTASAASAVADADGLRGCFPVRVGEWRTDMEGEPRGLGLEYGGRTSLYSESWSYPYPRATTTSAAAHPIAIHHARVNTGSDVPAHASSWPSPVCSSWTRSENEHAQAEELFCEYL